MARLFLWGVVPSLVAAAASPLRLRYGLLVHGLTLLLGCKVDRSVSPAHGLQAWLALRWLLSVVATAGCFFAQARG